VGIGAGSVFVVKATMLVAGRAVVMGSFVALGSVATDVKNGLGRMVNAARDPAASRDILTAVDRTANGIGQRVRVPSTSYHLFLMKG
jgi:hypothetical protein